MDKYKSLLLKQRDIMIALTARLNERDEQILILQEELEAYDTHQRKLEDDLDNRVSNIIAFRKQLAQCLAGDGGGQAPPIVTKLRQLLENSEDLTTGAPPTRNGPSLAAQQEKLAAVGTAPGPVNGAPPPAAGAPRSRPALEVTDMAEGREPPGSARGAAGSQAEVAREREAAAKEIESLSREVQDMRDVLHKSEKERFALKTIMENKMK